MTRTPPAVSVCVATSNRARFLPELLDALAAQVATGPFEVVVVDDASTDDTWTVLERLRSTGPLATTALRLAERGGPSAARNAAVAAGSGDLIAFVDDDCIPEPGWLAALTAPLQDPDVAVVQGRTLPTDDGPVGPWDRTIRVDRPSGLYETCNLACRRADFLATGGFPDLGLLPAGSSRGFGEDVVFGALLARRGRRSWRPDAVVRHRWLPGDYRDHLAGRWRLRGFPGIVAAVPELRGALWNRVFLSERTAAFDLAAAGVVAAVVGRRWLPLTATVPWLVRAVPEAQWKAGRPRWVRVSQLAVADAVGLAALVAGSLRHRRIVV